MTLGGRAAEELVFHEVTTGAANDLEKVTSTAKQMVMRFGMSEKLGPRVLGRNHDMPFLGREMGAEPDYSEEIAREIDDEIRRVIEEAHELAHARAARAHGRAAPDLADPDRARDDRQGPVRAAARRRGRGDGLPATEPTAGRAGAGRAEAAPQRRSRSPAAARSRARRCSRRPRGADELVQLGGAGGDAAPASEAQRRA